METLVILIGLIIVYGSYRIGKANGRNESFGFVAKEDGFSYSFESGKNFDETLKKIENLVKENAQLKHKIKLRLKEENKRNA